MDAADEVVAVVVVTYNSAPLLADLVASLPDGLSGLRWHLVVVDNASADDSVATARELWSAATIVETGRNGGYAAGINAGIEAAPPFTCVLVLNPDVRLEPGCVSTLIETLRRPGTGIAVPLLLDRTGERIDTLRREPSIRRTMADALIGADRAGRIATLGEVISDPKAYEQESITDWAEGSTLLLSAECLQACGRWDESYFLYSEETEYALRARDRGYLTRYNPAARAVHLEGDSAQSPALWGLLALNRVRLYRRRNGPVKAVGYWGALVLREGSRAMLGKSTSRVALRALVRPSLLRAPRGPATVATLNRSNRA
jgi:N-acetylglucosaminyl-diphospho-decaprenol L-rhamnosyltransferase